jgi:flavin reductase
MVDNGQEPQLATVQALQQPAGRRDPDEMVEGSLRDVMSQFASGITVLTAGGVCGHGMTANAFTSVSLDPPLVLCCVARPARFHESVLCAGTFGVSFLASDQEPVARYFADRRRPHGPVQFDSVDWIPGANTGAPLMAGALAWLECRLAKVYDGGDHVIFLGKVLSSMRGPDRKALLFYGGGYHHVLPPQAKSA